MCVLREDWTSESFGNVMKGDINSDLGIQAGFSEVVKVELNPEAGTCQQANVKERGSEGQRPRSCWGEEAGWFGISLGLH